MELPNEIIYSQARNPITPEMMLDISIILGRITTLLNRKGYSIIPDPEGQYYMVLKKRSHPSYNAGVIKINTAEGIISPSKILHRRYLNNEQYEDINIPSLHTPWINIDPRDGGQGLGPLLLGYAILHLFMLNQTLYYITLDDDSDHSGIFLKNIYIGLGFEYVDVSISNPTEAENLEHFRPLQEIRPTTLFFLPGNTQSSQPENDFDYESESESESESDEDDDIEDEEEYEFTWEDADSQMINTIPRLIEKLNAKIQKYESLQTELERQAEIKRHRKEKPHVKSKNPISKIKPKIKPKIKVSRGTIKKRKYGTKRRVKSFKRNVKSKIKREKGFNLTRSKSSAYSYK